MKKNTQTSLVRLVVTAMMSAVAIVLVLLFPVKMPPPISFLVYDMADIPVLIIAMMYGPGLGLFALAAAATLQAFLTPGGNEFVGLFMHFVSSGVLVLITGFAAQRFHKLKYTAIGMAFGISAVLGIMILLNLTVTVWFLGTLGVPEPRSMVIGCMPYIILFNAVKPVVNCAASLIVFGLLTPFFKNSGRVLGVKL